MSEDFDFENVPAETPLEHRPEEAICRRHRREKKELQGRILALKKSVNKSDKKRKKEVEAEIEMLESELNLRHKMEVDMFHSKNQPTTLEETSVDLSKLHLDAQDFDSTSLDKLSESTQGGPVLNSSPGTPKVSRAQKRREKKSNQERESQRRIAVETEELVENSLWKKEDTQFALILNDLKLEVFDIPADGDCLYSAVSHQLQQHRKNSHSSTSLRQQTASYLQNHKEEFVPFMDEHVTASDDTFNKYCNEIATTAVWGGQLEIQVLSKFLELPIRVIQTDSPHLIFGQELEEPMLTLTYHRHKIQAGEHYNSTIPKLETNPMDP